MRHASLIPLALIASLACGCSADSDSKGYAGGGSGATAGSGGSGGTTYDASTGGNGFDATIPINPDSGDMDGWVQPDGDTCSAQSVAAEPYPLDMYVMIDQSGSMNGDIGISGKSKWKALVDAFTSFLNTTPQQGLSMGMQFFPLPIKPWSQMPSCNPSGSDCGDGLCVTVDIGPHCHDSCTNNSNCGSGSECRGSNPGFCSNDQCDPNVYATPEVPIGELPGANAAIISALNAHGPLTMTPTGPAIEGSIKYAREWAIAHPERTTIVVLATDGMPTVCSASDSEIQRLNKVKQFAQAGVNGTPSIKTFVIGVEMAMNFMAINNLHGMAAAGGTGQAFIVNPNQDMTSQFAAALEAIRGAAMECEFKIPTSGAMLDYDEVNVVYTAVNNTEHTVFYVGDMSQCDPVIGGWFYDTDPAQTKPTKILLCPQSCDFMQDHGGKIDIEIGCKTIKPPK